MGGRLELKPARSSLTSSPDPSTSLLSWKTSCRAPGQETRTEVEALVDQWRIAYGLDDPRMDKVVALPEAVPRAPHLDDCKDLDTTNR